MAARRSGDVASCYADPGLAAKELAWKAEFDLERMCKPLDACFNFFKQIITMEMFYDFYVSIKYFHLIRKYVFFLFWFFFTGAGQDLWRWQSMNPTGFSKNTAS